MLGLISHTYKLVSKFILISKEESIVRSQSTRIRQKECSRTAMSQNIQLAARHEQLNKLFGYV